VKILHIADLHNVCLYRLLGKRSAFHRHWDVAIELDTIINRHKPDVITLGGDIYNSFNPGSWELLPFTYLLACIKKLDIPIVMIPGNHDIEGTPGDFSIVFLLPLANIYNLHMVTRNTKTFVVRDATFIGWPPGVYPNKEYAKRVSKYPKPRIGLMHVPFYGAWISMDKRRLRTGFKLEAAKKTVDEFELDYLLLGDVHEYQVLDENSCIIYPGSTLQTRFNESPKKGVVLVDTRTHKHKFIPIRSPAKLKTIENLKDVNSKDYFRLSLTDKKEAMSILSHLPQRIVKVVYDFKGEVEEVNIPLKKIEWRIDLLDIIEKCLGSTIKDPKKSLNYLTKIIGSEDLLTLP
jgi:DNA repair exonuclease SbcCD nuclease subunit